MKILVISGSYRKGKTIDTLIDKAIEGAKAANGSVEVERITLIDKKIEYCKNCMLCKKDDPQKNIANCSIKDDMQEIYSKLDEADAFILGCPVNIGYATAVMKTFLERVCYVLGKPGKFPLEGCPMPRSKKKKKAIIIVSSGIVPPALRMFCDQATPLIKDVCGCVLNAKTAGALYAGAVSKKGVDAYFAKARELGRILVK